MIARSETSSCATTSRAGGADRTSSRGVPPDRHERLARWSWRPQTVALDEPAADLLRDLVVALPRQAQASADERDRVLSAREPGGRFDLVVLAIRVEAERADSFERVIGRRPRWPLEAVVPLPQVGHPHERMCRRHLDHDTAARVRVERRHEPFQIGSVIEDVVTHDDVAGRRFRFDIRPPAEYLFGRDAALERGVAE